MAQFAPFDYGNVLAREQDIRGARNRNALAQQQLDPQSVGNQLQREQLTGARQGNVLAQQAGDRAQTTFNQGQQEQNTQLLYQYLTEISQNPNAAGKLIPELQQMGIMRSDFDYQSMSPEEIQSKAAQGAQAIGKSLGMGKAGKGPSSVQEYNFYENLDAKGKETFLKIKRAQPNAKFVDKGDQVEVFDPVTAQPITVIEKGLAPKDQPKNVEEAATIKADVARKADMVKKRPKAISTYQALTRQTKTVNSHIDKALNLIGPFSTGAAGWFAGMPNSDAGKLRNELDTIRANVGFDKLQNMRDNSPTGGALGQVSELENRLLQAVNGALDPMQSDQLETNLVAIKELYSQVLEEKKQQMYSDYEYGDAPQELGPSQADLEFTAKQHGITIEEVMQRLGAQ